MPVPRKSRLAPAPACWKGLGDSRTVEQLGGSRPHPRSSYSSFPSGTGTGTGTGNGNGNGADRNPCARQAGRTLASDRVYR